MLFLRHNPPIASCAKTDLTGFYKEPGRPQRKDRRPSTLRFGRRKADVHRTSCALGTESVRSADVSRSVVPRDVIETVIIKFPGARYGRPERVCRDDLRFAPVRAERVPNGHPAPLRSRVADAVRIYTATLTRHRGVRKKSRRRTGGRLCGMKRRDPTGDGGITRSACKSSVRFLRA